MSLPQEIIDQPWLIPYYQGPDPISNARDKQFFDRGTKIVLYRERQELQSTRDRDLPRETVSLNPNDVRYGQVIPRPVFREGMVTRRALNIARQRVSTDSRWKDFLYYEKFRNQLNNGELKLDLNWPSWIPVWLRQEASAMTMRKMEEVYNRQHKDHDVFEATVGLSALDITDEDLRAEWDRLYGIPEAKARFEAVATRGYEKAMGL